MAPRMVSRGVIAKLEALADEVVACRACPRLVEWRERVAAEKRAAFADETYWGRPVPGFGDPHAPIVIVGLAPAAHGANRTGRVFTGDRSGDWLFRALHRAGLANQPHSVSADDGLKLHGVWISAPVRCAPPDNKPTTAERDNCAPFLDRELDLLGPTVVVCLGGFGFAAACRHYRSAPAEVRPRRRDRRAGRPDAAVLVSPQPAEHLHRQADRTDARRRHASRRHPREPPDGRGRTVEHGIPSLPHRGNHS